MTKITTPSLPADELALVGEFTLAEALSAARNLEHAGITTTLASAGATWSLHVPAAELDRACRLA